MDELSRNGPRFLCENLLLLQLKAKIKVKKTTQMRRIAAVIDIV